MSRPQEEARYGDLPPCWNYREQQEPVAASSPYPQLHPRNMYSTETFQASYTPSGTIGSDVIVDDRYAGETARMTGYQNYGHRDVGNVRLVGKVMYDENRQRRFVIPVDTQYELFERAPSSPGLSPGAYSMPADFSTTAATSEFTPRSLHPHHGTYASVSDASTSNFIKDVLGNWEPNTTGTYSPFGQHFPLNHPSATSPEPVHDDNATDEAKLVSSQKNVNPPRRTDQNPLADTNRKRIVAEVKPMRPSYSDVLAKNNKTPPTIEPMKKTPSQIGLDTKFISVKNGVNKASQPNTKFTEEAKQKTEKGKHVRSPPSSGSDSGDFNIEENDKTSKNAKRGKTKSSDTSGSWSSLHNGLQENEVPFEQTSDFIFVENPPDKVPKKGKKEKQKSEKSQDTEEEHNIGNEEDSPARDNMWDLNKAKKKKDKTAGVVKTAVKAADKKKGTCKVKRGKATGYLGVMQGCIERWTGASLKAVVWFWYLLSDICHMSAHLSFDLLTSVFTQTYVSGQAVWRGGKEWMSQLRDSKYLQYIDKKLGDTPLGFWRKINWFKKVKDPMEPNDGTNSNIPLPATGEEAMKRLLACKGKDPYSILGVTVSCTDEEIKRYYRRQAFLVHPDKNQQPGAEEAFKILQHAFDLIGEPERREAFDRRTLEHQHVEAAWSELSTLLAQLQDKMEVAANTIRCTNCGRRHKRVITDRPCYAARYCSQCKIRHSAKEGDIWAESGLWGLLVMYYACMDGAVYQITQWASCQKKNLRQLKPNCHVVQYRIVLGNKAGAAPNLNQRPSTSGNDPNLEEFLNNLYGSSRAPPAPPGDGLDPRPRRKQKKTKP